MFVKEWVDDFHHNYMKPAEDDLSPLQKEIFEVSWDVEAGYSLKKNKKVSWKDCRDMLELSI